MVTITKTFVIIGQIWCRFYGICERNNISNYVNFETEIAASSWFQLIYHYNGVMMSAMASQINSLTMVCGHRWIPHTKDQWRRKCFHLMTS